MRVFENQENQYNFDDIVDAIEDELGFSFISSIKEKSGYYVLGSEIRLVVDFNGDIKITLQFPNRRVDMSENNMTAEAYATAIESAEQIIEIIERMTE